MEKVGGSGMKATLISSLKDGILIYQINKHNGLYDLFQPSLKYAGNQSHTLGISGGGKSGLALMIHSNVKP